MVTGINPSEETTFRTFRSAINSIRVARMLSGMPGPKSRPGRLEEPIISSGMCNSSFLLNWGISIGSFLRTVGIDTTGTAFDIVCTFGATGTGGVAVGLGAGATDAVGLGAVTFGSGGF